jgi:hypothetical protein
MKECNIEHKTIKGKIMFDASKFYDKNEKLTVFQAGTG